MRRSRRQPALRPLLAIALVAAWAASGAACRSLRPVVNEEQPLTDRDLAMAWTSAQNRSAGNFSEQLKIDIALDGGGTLYTKLTVTNVAKYDGRAELLGKLDLPEDRSFRVKVKKDRDEWTFGRERFDATLGDCTVVMGVGRVDVHLVGEDFVLDYAIESELPPLRPPGGRVDVGGAFYVTTVPVPRGRMTGTLVVRRAAEEEGAEPEEETIALEGVAFVEHRATDLAPYRMAKRWFKMSEVDLERTVVVSAFERSAELGGTPQGWVLVADDEGVVVYEGDAVVSPRAETTDAQTGYGIPAVLYLEGKKGPGMRGIVRANAMSQRRDDLANLSRLERAVVRRLMKPWTFLFDEADYLFKAPAADGEGDEGDWRGAGRFEVQQLNPE